MGGKRPDQYNIDPREAGTTDYKNLGQSGQGESSLDDTLRLDRQRMGQQEAELKAEGSGPFNPGKPAPSKFANAGRPVEPPAADESKSGREREAEGTEDPRERGVGG